MHSVSIVPQGPDRMCELLRAYEQIVGIVSRNRQQAHLRSSQSSSQRGEHTNGFKRKWSMYFQRMPAHRCGGTPGRLLLATDYREFVLSSRDGDKRRGFERP